MLRFKIENDSVVAISSDASACLSSGWEGRHEWKSFERAEVVAESASVLTGDIYIAIDNGRNCSPRFDVVKAPKVGDVVSFGFNGDYYPDGEVVSISKTMKVITTSSGKRYYRVKKTGSWKSDKTWSLVMGHHDRRNPSF